jgi:hypothetical protein
MPRFRLAHWTLDTDTQMTQQPQPDRHRFRQRMSF